jgi:hypothetical protein
MRAVLAACAAAACACSSSSPADTTTTTTTTSTGSQTAGSQSTGSSTPPSPSPQDAAMTLAEREYTRGPSIYPADQLLAWLEQQKPDVGEVVLRLPVQVTLKPSKMSLKSAQIGDRPDALAIKINDLSLGVPVSARMQQLCEGKDTCMLWLRGVWRGNLEFQVSRLEGVISDAERASATYVEIAK